MKLASIDIGSNSIHLAVVQAIEGQHLQIVDREKEMVRLGSGTLRQHQLSQDTIDRAIETLRRFKQMAEANRVERIIATATSAVRESRNADEFIERVRTEVGLEVDVLPGVEEARLIALAVSEVTDFNNQRALIVDIGGGSTEFIVTSGQEPELLLSVRMGAVRLTEKFITTDPISEKERERLAGMMRVDLTRAVWEIKNVGFDFVIGTSGTVLNIVDAIVQGEPGPEHRAPAGFESFSHTITLEQLKRFNARLIGMPLKQRRRIPGLEKERADIIIAGALLLEVILTELNIQEIRSCDWSLREGVVLDYLRRRIRGSGGSPAATEMETGDLIEAAPDVRARSVLSVARRYEYDRAHSHHVARLANKIFDGTQAIHGLGEGERKLLEYAALLHDLGYHIAHNNHHRHGLYLIKNSEMPGFTGGEIAQIATIVRYHRGSLPKKVSDPRDLREHDDFFALDPSNRDLVLKLAAILQIADGLDRAHNQLVRDLKCDTVNRNVTITIFSDVPCDLELWSADRKASVFRDLFGVSVTMQNLCQ